jgi:hypothetical protein
LPLLGRTLTCLSHRQRTAQIHCSRTRIRGHGRLNANHYFSPRNFLTASSAAEILDSLKTYAADGGARPISGGTPFRQPCPAYPSTLGRKAPQERFSEESFRTSYNRKRISLKLHCKFAAHTAAENQQHTASLDELAEPNYYSKYLQTSSTDDFASHSPDGSATELA